MNAMLERQPIRQAVLASLLVFAGSSAWADDGDDVDAETTIRLMDTAEANSSLVVTRDIALPENARVDPPGRRKSAAGNGKDQEKRDQRDQRDRGDRGRSRADEARDNARDMSDDARENRENRGRSGDPPGRGRPDRPDPPKGPPGK